MPASSVADSWAGGAVEERTLGAASKMAAPITINEEEVVVISDDEEDVQVNQKGVGGRVSGGISSTPRRRVGCVGGPDKVCAVWIVGHSFVRWAEKQAASQHFGRQLGLDGTRIKISWVGKSGMRWGELLCVLAKRMERGKAQAPGAFRCSKTPAMSSQEAYLIGPAYNNHQYTLEMSFGLEKCPSNPK
ncbi:hypothetical protein NDU88_001265 [Pleurodeles waltl]|uniref:Uncharacterized protein n=1 Tax=Pleurodeles waltl TaxID=8319 RepID=A0AAV7NDQ5_PLEWA|nr:hypothetical protein NDU88_001265 [Pleurodeles waltl]